MNRYINHVTVLGSGVMGSQIACHFANIGLPVLLLDIVPKELTDLEKQKGRSLDDKAVRNRVANDNLKQTLKSKIPPLYKKEYKDRIQTGNFEDDLSRINDSDWVIEAIVENLDIKKSLFEQVEQYRKPGTLISSNTSSIPIHYMLEGRSEDFQQHFAGTHFFNPPRYLPLLEVIPTQSTKQAITDFYLDYGDRFLGKTTLQCKDTPAFIANRVGVYAIMLTLQLMQEMELTVDEIDTFTGPVMGRPKSATFRTADLVGLDVLAEVANGLSKGLKGDEEKDIFKVPDYLNQMLVNGWQGEKSGQGFFKKVKEHGESKIYTLDINTMEYHPQQKPSFQTVEQAKQAGSLKDKLRTLIKGQDKAGEFYRRFFSRFLGYVSRRIPEISDTIYQVDEGLRAGFDWKYGPFEIWDLLGVQQMRDAMKEQGIEPASWVDDMLKEGHNNFYQIEDGYRQYYDLQNKDYALVPATQEFILLDNYSNNVVWNNSECTVYDIGDGVLNVEFHSRGNSLGSEVLKGIQEGIALAEENYRGVVIANEGNNFSVGANLGLIFMMAVEQEFDELQMAVKQFQDTMMCIRYSNVPVVAAPHNQTLGGGNEICLHADAVQAYAETYMGLVEVGAGVIPAGGGSKEMTKRAAEHFYEGDPEIPNLQNYLLTLAQAQVSYSAMQGYDLHFLQPGKDRITMNRKRLIKDAKDRVLQFSKAGYTKPLPQKIKVLGRGALGTFYTGANGFYQGNFITEHDLKISQKLAYVMCGGDLTAPQEVSEQYLLDLEREAFVSLCGEQKTMKRMEQLVNTGKPLRN